MLPVLPLFHRPRALGLFASLLLAFPMPQAAAAADSRECDALASVLERLEATVGRPAGRLRDPASRWRQRAIAITARRYADRCVRLNQVQVIGSHNSYHIQPIPELIAIYTLADPQVIFWEYTHVPLPEQFGPQGIRQIELDVYSDPDGGYYSRPRGQLLIDPNALIPELDPPGTKVLHVQDLDWNTTCQFLVECLAQVRDWSLANPDHLPLFVLIEAKDDPTPISGPPPPFDTAAFDTMDAEIRSVFAPGHVIIPDEVRGDRATLEEAILTDGWPTLGASRGRILFGLDNSGSKRLAYLAGHPGLQDRILFTNANPGDDDAAFVKRNDPLGDLEIPDLVRAGYLVRTRADGDTVQSRNNDTTQRDAALESGAQYVSTDYRLPDLDFSPYQVTLPGEVPGRCNPENAPPGCRDTALEPAP